MWNGYLPFQVQKVTKIPIFQSRAELKADTPETLKALLDRMLELDPAERITMDQLRVSLPSRLSRIIHGICWLTCFFTFLCRRTFG